MTGFYSLIVLSRDAEGSMTTVEFILEVTHSFYKSSRRSMCELIMSVYRVVDR